jgi:polygalacturonase
MVWKGRNIFTGKSWRLCSGILIFACALTLATCSAHAAAKTFLANDYGAKGDGSTLNTVSIQKTIDAAANSGGTVTFKPGTYLTGSLFMKSGTRLDVGEGLILIGSQKLDDYPMLPTRIAGIEMAWPSALINVRGQHDVTIGGKGTIDGDGPIWWKSYWDLRATYEPKGLRWASDYDARRPRLILLQNSSDIHLGDGILLKRSGFWTVQVLYSDHVAAGRQISLLHQGPVSHQPLEGARGRRSNLQGSGRPISIRESGY